MNLKAWISELLQMNVAAIDLIPSCHWRNASACNSLTGTLVMIYISASDLSLLSFLPLGMPDSHACQIYMLGFPFQILITVKETVGTWICKISFWLSNNYLSCLTLRKYKTSSSIGSYSEHSRVECLINQIFWFVKVNQNEITIFSMIYNISVFNNEISLKCT